MNRIYLYGFNDEHKVIAYRYVENPSVWVLRKVSKSMMDWYPGIQKIFALDQRRGLAQDFLDAFKSKDFVEGIAFEDICIREGVEININY